MFVVLVCFLVIILMMFSIGKSVVLSFDKTNSSYTFFDLFFIGLVSCSSFLSIWAIFLPTNIFSFLFLLVLSIVFFIYFKINIELKRYFYLLINNKLFLATTLTCVFIVVLFSVVTPQQYDTYLYHINAIQWSHDYKCVPGLANLHNRLGFNSSVFLLNSCFSFFSIYNQYLFLINSLSYLIFLLFIVRNIYNYKGVVGFFLLIFLALFTNQYYSEISSPGSDVLPNIIMSYLLIKLLILPLNKIKEQYLIFITLPIFCITLKVSTIPITLLLLIIFQKRNIFFINLAKTSIIGTIILLPWIIRNIILTGYLIYPTTVIDIFDFDWKVPATHVVELEHWVLSWARVPSQEYNIVLQMSLEEWVKIWWKALNIINKTLIISAIFSPIIVIIYFIFNKKKFENYINYVVFFIIGITSVVFWFFTAPDIRFIYGIIVLMSLSVFLIFFNFSKKNPLINVFLNFCSLFFFLYFINESIYFFNKDYQFSNVEKYIYLPKDIYFKKFIQKVSFNKELFNSIDNENIYIYQPVEKNQCFDQIPCSPKLNPNLKLRGNNLKDGFKIQ